MVSRRRDLKLLRNAQEQERASLMPSEKVLNLKPSNFETIDKAVLRWVDEILGLHATTNDGWKKVPVVWITAERAFQIKHKKDITITNPNMTRFMMSLDDSINLVIYAMKKGQQGEIFVQKSPSSTIELIANTLKKIKKSTSKIKIISTRHGEKDHKVLVSNEEMTRAKIENKYYA